MLVKRYCFVAAFLLLVPAVAAAATAEKQTEKGIGKQTFQEARFEKGQLRYRNHVPVLSVEGTPEEIGREEAALTGEVVKGAAAFPRQIMILSGQGAKWEKCVQTAQALTSHAPAAYRDELRSYAAKAGVPMDLLQVANTIMDLHRGGFACSSLMVEAAKSKTGAVLFGRNLDFFTLGVLDRYGLVAVYRTEGKHAFATVGFPGVIGCISGMNDAGLALAVHEVRITADYAPMLNPKAMPYTFCLRSILEECTTIEEAQKLLRSSERSTILSVAICDRAGAGVLEITPKTVALRRGSDGICVNTNHFRTHGLRLWTACPRYAILSKATAMDKLGVDDIFKKLDEVHQDVRTVQSMVFEPVPLILHVAMGKIPATKGPLETLELKPLFNPAEQKDK